MRAYCELRCLRTRELGNSKAPCLYLPAAIPAATTTADTSKCGSGQWGLMLDVGRVARPNWLWFVIGCHRACGRCS